MKKDNAKKIDDIKKKMKIQIQDEIDEVEKSRNREEFEVEAVAEEIESNPLIKFDRVSKFFKDDKNVLENIDLEIKPGEFVSIVGHSGAGKSTFLKLIYAEEMPSQGSVYFDGISLGQISRGKLPYHRRRIGTIFQDFKLLPRKTAFENVAYALEVCGAPKEEIFEDVPKILDIVGLGDKMEKFPHQLSGGEQQKVVLARALIHKPDVIAADEPTGNLDPENSLEILKLLLQINNLGTTVILASHDHDVVNKANKRVIVLDRGKIICDEAKGKYKIC
jgi:cell division transport system ATP-binding protein